MLGGVVEVELLCAHGAHDDVEDAELAGGERACRGRGGERYNECNRKQPNGQETLLHFAHHGNTATLRYGWPRTDHDATGSQAHGRQLDEARLLGDVDQALRGGATAARARLVDLGQQRVGGVGDDGRSHTRNHACTWERR